MQKWPADEQRNDDADSQTHVGYHEMQVRLNLPRQARLLPIRFNYELRTQLLLIRFNYRF